MGVRSRAASESSIGGRNGIFSRSILCPSFASTAMSSELAISTVVRTPSAEPIPSFVMKSMPEEGQAGDRDRDGQAGEERRSTGRRTRLGRGVTRRQALVQELAEARDDEQRVVDPDAETDHRHEQRRDRVDVGEPGEDEEEQERRHERDDRERERDRRRDERAEDDEQHDERREQAEQPPACPARSAGTRRRR